jgi:hypothetical protein
MRQVIDIRKLPLCEPPRATWLGWLRARLFGSTHRKNIIALQDCSAHFLRDIGLLDDQRANRLLQDHNLFRR